MDAGYCERKEGRAAGETDCKWEDCQAKWDVGESAELAVLLPICEGRGSAREIKEREGGYDEEQAIEASKNYMKRDI
jgi:hypothetical protein